MGGRGKRKGRLTSQTKKKTDEGGKKGKKKSLGKLTGSRKLVEVLERLGNLPGTPESWVNVTRKGPKKRERWQGRQVSLEGGDTKT